MKQTHKIDRRTFTKQTGLLFATGLLSSCNMFTTVSSKYKIGLQLFTIRDAMKKDPLGSLKSVAALGYKDLETYGYDIQNNSYYGYEAKEFKQILDDLDLTATSGHYNFSDYFDKSDDERKRFVDRCIVGAKALDKKYITWPWLAPEYRNLSSFKKLAEQLNKIGEQINSSELGFAYHNHDFEFILHNGEIGYDIILNETDASLVKLQMDMYWIEYASKMSPVEWIAKQPGRFVMWHIKDMDKVSRDYTELGNGSIDYVNILSKINTDDLKYYYIEQGANYAQNSMQSIADSISYFKKNLQEYLLSANLGLKYQF